MQGRHGKQSPINIILFAMVGVSMVFVSSLASLIVVTHEVHMLLNSFPWITVRRNVFQATVCLFPSCDRRHSLGLSFPRL